MQAAVVLSGCGYLDGAEIREAVLSLLYLDQASVTVQCFAPDVVQAETINHATKEPESAARNVLAEAARIARSEIAPLSNLRPEMFDLLVIPGGFGVAKNLSDFAFKGAECQVLPEFQQLIAAFFEAKKPIIAICIAPAILAAALKNKNITVTIGDNADVAAAISFFGNTHQNCASDNAVVDTENRIVTCSAYMREDAIAPIAKGIETAIRAGVAMARNQQQQAA